MRIRSLLLALSASLLFAPQVTALAEFGIEGIGVVSTRADELRATRSADGRRLVWASNREGGAGGWDLWQATWQESRWTDARPLLLGTAADEVDPFLSADGRWLYFASNRGGGHGGFDLYRAALLDDGGFGPAQNLGATINGADDERSPALREDDGTLLLASNRGGGAGGWDLWSARRAGDGFAAPQPMAGLNSPGDELDGSWLAGGRAVVFARGNGSGGAQLQLSHCRNGRWNAAEPLALSFNTAEGDTRAALVDASTPGELLVSGHARAPRAGGFDLYRMRAPASNGSDDCR
ncbi:MAG: PD40 domain-containing protein [Stenotrophomonas nitritireducens]|uniref:TolB family protein n=1 Tax=Stenotrophomonas nitritireducens TaxID=83617 RepID=UPI001AD2C036|nr:TolB-like protein [Stenotrophomonas nitritireducens]MBN8791812.1 PD40 domain-containing protein [Stenotrophomonas nitritireducens]MBN8795749.1 PD40 domain-containing protein [Stenotrophomonas nitritireducens]